MMPNVRQFRRRFGTKPIGNSMGCVTNLYGTNLNIMDDIHDGLVVVRRMEAPNRSQYNLCGVRHDCMDAEVSVKSGTFTEGRDRHHLRVPFVLWVNTFFLKLVINLSYHFAAMVKYSG
ncbi:MAG: hypothetical protein ACE5EH_06845 [Gammaproteobacteria bacterium]